MRPNSTALLSVIIPITRMAGKFQNLKINLENSKNLNIELILVHDLQDESTKIELMQLLEEFDHLNIKFIEQTFNSPGLARNAGLDSALGDWIAFWDSDDLVEVPGYLKLIEKTRLSNSAIGLGMLETISAISNEPVFVTPKIMYKNAKSIYDLAYYPGFTRFIFNREIFGKIRFTNALIGEDLEYLARAKFLDYEIFFSNEVIYKYIVNSGTQATSQKNNQHLFEIGRHLVDSLQNQSLVMKQYIVAQSARICVVLVKDPKYLLKSFRLLHSIFAISIMLSFKGIVQMLRRGFVKRFKF